jgi:hypothetical protein
LEFWHTFTQKCNRQYLQNHGQDVIATPNPAPTPCWPRAPRRTLCSSLQAPSRS